MTIKSSITSDDILAFNIYSQTKWSVSKYAYFLIGIVELIILFQLVLTGDLFIVFPMLIFTIFAAVVFFGSRYPKLVAILSGSIIVIIGALFYLPSGDINALKASLILSWPFLIIGSWGYFSRAWIRSMYAGKKIMLGPSETTFDEKGISSKAKNTEGRLDWILVDTIEQNKEYIFIFVDKLRALIIPKRDLGSEDNINSFYKKIIELKESASKAVPLDQSV